MYSLTIIGGGPRGLAALERFVANCAELENNNIQILLVEPQQNPGVGTAWSKSQEASNWINISERDKDIAGRSEIVLKNVIIPSFPGYHEWSGYYPEIVSEEQPDSFPPRKKLGNYLHERYLSITTALKKAGIFKHLQSKATKLQVQTAGFIITTTNNNTFKSREVVLCMGHLKTNLSKDLARWQRFCDEHPNLRLFTNAYPVSDIIKSLSSQPANHIAIRGFGLAMIDVTRAICEAFEGRFDVIDQQTKKLKFSAKQNQEFKLFPFSLDGLPPAPKPLNAKIDNWFALSDSQRKEAQRQFEQLTGHNAPESPYQAFIDCMAQQSAKVFIALKERAVSHSYDKNQIKEIAEQWLLNENYKHELICDDQQNSMDLMQEFVQMATGERPIKLDYCIGQVWRHLEPSMYGCFSHSGLPAATLAQIIALDEKLKRYSYGPPVESLQQLLALHRAGVLFVNLSDDPDIRLDKNGWHLKDDNNKRQCTVMINTVLDNPDLATVNDPLISQLREDSLVSQVGNSLGIATRHDGCIAQYSLDDYIALAVLGRMAKGSVMGVDAILECFGPRIDAWAKNAAQRITNANN